MIYDKKLASFERDNVHYEVFGLCTLTTVSDATGGKHHSAIFKNLSMTTDGKPYEPKGYFWSGTPVEIEDILCDFLSSLTRHDGKYLKRYIQPEVEQMVDSYYLPVAIVNDRPVSKYILSNSDLSAYMLLIGTNKYLYYANGDSMIMLDTATHSLISDNHFAEDGFWMSVHEIKENRETLMYGMLPQEKVDPA